MSKGKVLEFPKSKIVRENIPDSAEVEKLKEKNKRRYADGIVEEMSQEILMSFSEMGIEMGPNEFHFLVATLYSIVYRTMKMDHPFHSFIEKNIKLITPDKLKSLKENLEDAPSEEVYSVDRDLDKD